MNRYDVVTIQEDLEDYTEFLMENDIDGCLWIETRYGLDGYPPNVVGAALAAGANGEDIHEYLDKVL